MSSTTRIGYTMVRTTAAAERNKSFIISAIQDLNLFSKTKKETVLEIASGSGVHVVDFATTWPNMTFIPTDYDTSNVTDINQRLHDLRKSIQDVETVDNRHHFNYSNILPAVQLDCSLPASQWNIQEKVSHCIAINLCHISPWTVTRGLFEGCKTLFSKDANTIDSQINCSNNDVHDANYVIIYGPFDLDGKHTSQGNADFHKDLRSRDPSWGIRDVEDMKQIGAEYNFQLRHRVDMPANNMILVFEFNHQLENLQ